MRIPFAINSYRDRFLHVSAQRVINRFVEAAPQDAKSRLVLRATPGLVRFANVPNGAVRGMHVMGSYLYVVAGTTVSRVAADGTVVVLGLVGTGGPVSMADNGSQVVIVVPETGGGYIATETSMVPILDPDFGQAASVAVLDGFGLFTVRDSNQFFISALNDLAQYDALDFASAEASPDNLLRVLRVGSVAWLLGERTVELWNNSGGATFPFQRITGGVLQRGLAARNAAAVANEQVLWLGDNRWVYKSSGSAPERISTHAVEQTIGGYVTVADARAWTYEQEGHTFFALSFPTDKATWVYDLATGVWHERASEDYGIWRCTCGVAFAGGVVAGDAQAGILYLLDPTAGTEDGSKIVRSATGAPLHNEAKRLFVQSLTVEMSVGLGETGIATDEARDPEVRLSWSDDGGHTFGSEVRRTIGREGRYRQRVRFDRLGAGRDRVFRLTDSNPMPSAIIAADFDVVQGRT